MSFLDSFKRKGLEVILGTAILATGVGAAAQSVPQFNKPPAHVERAPPTSSGVPQFTKAPTDHSGKLQAPVEHTYEIVNVQYRNGMMGGAIKDQQTGKLVPLYGMITQFYDADRGAGATFLDKAIWLLQKRGVAKDLIKEADLKYVVPAGDYHAETRNGNLYLSIGSSTEEIIVQKKEVDMIEALVTRENEAEYWLKGAQDAGHGAENLKNTWDAATSPGFH